MNNKEKAKEIAKKCKTVTERAIKDGYNGETIWIKESNYDDCYKSALKMAQWKDEQFKEQKKLTWKEVKYIIELDGDIETGNFMGSDEYYQAIADKANVVLFGLQGKLED